MRAPDYSEPRCLDCGGGGYLEPAGGPLRECPACDATGGVSAAVALRQYGRRARAGIVSERELERVLELAAAELVAELGPDVSDCFGRALLQAAFSAHVAQGVAERELRPRPRLEDWPDTPGRGARFLTAVAEWETATGRRWADGEPGS